MRRHWLWLVTLLLGTQSLFPQNSPQEIERKLQARFVSKTLVLRGYYRAKQLRFDANGQVIGKGDAGLGSADGSIHVNDIALKAAPYTSPPQLVIFGYLPIAVADLRTKSIRLRHSSLDRLVTIQLDEPLTFETAVQSLQSVFQEDVNGSSHTMAQCSQEEVSRFWRWVAAYAAGGEGPANSRIHPAEVASTASVRTADAACLPGGVRLPSLGVTPPAATYAPDPEYTREAQQARLEGLVVIHFIVDSTGKASSTVVVKSLDEGLDEAAVRTLQQWKFRPGMKDGAPVPVFVSLEVNFKLKR